MKIGGLQKFSLIDYPNKIACSIFLSGCDFRCGFCFTGDNLVFTDKGVLTIKEISKNKLDCKVYGINGNFNKISNFYKRKHSGKIIQIKTYLNTELIECTPDHKFFVYSDKGIVKKKAEQLTYEDYLSIRIPQRNQKVILDTKIAFLELYEELNFREISIKPKLLEKIAILRKKKYSWRKIYKIIGITGYARRIYNKSYFKNKKKVPVIKRKGNKIALKGSNFYVNKIFEVDMDLAKLIGYYLAEGCVSKTRNRKNSYYISFTFNKKEKEYIAEVKRIFKDKFDVLLREVYNKKNKTLTLVTGKGVIAILFKYYFGKNVYTKTIPLSFLYLNRNIQKELIKGLFFGDGITSKKYIAKYQKQRIQLTSKELLYKISLVLYRLGLINSRFRNELIITDKHIFELLGQSELISKKRISTRRYNKINSEYIFVRIKNIKNKMVKSREVYNLEINDPNHAYNISLYNVSNCHNPELVFNEESNFSEKEVLDFLEKRKGKLEGVCITGGEPLINNDLIEFLKKIKNLGYEIKIDTNGSNSELLKKIIEDKLVDYIALDIKADKDNYNKISGVNIDITKIEKSLNLIINSGIDYEVRTTAVRNYNNLEKIGEWLNNFKIKKYVIQNFVIRDKLIDNNFKEIKQYSEEELNEIKDSIKKYYEKVEIRV